MYSAFELGVSFVCGSREFSANVRRTRSRFRHNFLFINNIFCLVGQVFFLRAPLAIITVILEQLSEVREVEFIKWAKGKLS